MKIKSIEIKNISSGGFSGECENLRHYKVLPLLSVVQSVQGYYEIGLGEEKLCKTQEGGAFVAPAGISQQIIHHNGTKGCFEAQWIFMNITVNNLFILLKSLRHL